MATAMPQVRVAGVTAARAKGGFLECITADAKHGGAACEPPANRGRKRILELILAEMNDDEDVVWYEAGLCRRVGRPQSLHPRDVKSKGGDEMCLLT